MANQYTDGWTDEQIEYLEFNVGIYSFERIAKKIGKSPEAVLRKAEKLGIANTKIACGLYTMHELAQALCIDDKVVKRLITDYALPGKQKDYRTREIDEEGRKKPKRCFYYIDIKAFWKWAENNKDLINWYQVPVRSLPFEPEWLKERRKEDYYKWLKRPRPWTPEEDNLLWSMYYVEGRPQKEIAETMLRTVAGVQRRLQRLREQRQVCAS